MPGLPHVACCLVAAQQIGCMQLHCDMEASRGTAEMQACADTWLKSPGR